MSAGTSKLNNVCDIARSDLQLRSNQRGQTIRISDHVAPEFRPSDYECAHQPRLPSI